MDNGSIWGHGGYLGPDFSAQYLHKSCARTSAQALAHAAPRQPLRRSGAGRPRRGRRRWFAPTLKAEPLRRRHGTLTFTDGEADSYRRQIDEWAELFLKPAGNGGLPPDSSRPGEELRQLTAFFAWTAWASVDQPARRDRISYTNNFPYDPLAGNVPTGGAVLCSALSLIVAARRHRRSCCWPSASSTTSAGIERASRSRPRLVPGNPTPSSARGREVLGDRRRCCSWRRRWSAAPSRTTAPSPATSTASICRAFLPSNLLRTWHLQLAIFWIATAYVAGALFLAAGWATASRSGQRRVHPCAVRRARGRRRSAACSGEWAGTFQQLLGEPWFWFGNQGWEYLELGRAWQILLAVGLVFWFWPAGRATWRRRSRTRAARAHRASS